MDAILIWSRAVLETTPARWLSLTQSLPDELLNLPPAAGEWSATGCLQHLLDTERGVFPARVQRLLAGEDFPAFDPDSEGTDVAAGADARSLAREFASLRAQSLALFERLGSSDLTRTARHSELGTVTLAELLHEWAGHDLMHTVQAERALMQPFIAGSGPWRPYFADHWARDESASG